MERSFFLRKGLLKDFPECPLSHSRSLVSLPSVWALFVSDGWLASRGLYDNISASFFHLTVLSLPSGLPSHNKLSAMVAVPAVITPAVPQAITQPWLSWGQCVLCSEWYIPFSSLSLPGRAGCFGSVPWMV